MPGWHCGGARQSLAAAAVGRANGAGQGPGKEPRQLRRLEGSGAGQHRTAGPAHPDGNDATERGGSRLGLASSHRERRRPAAPSAGRGDSTDSQQLRPPLRGNGRRRKTPPSGLYRSRAAQGGAAPPYRTRAVPDDAGLGEAQPGGEAPHHSALHPAAPARSPRSARPCDAQAGSAADWPFPPPIIALYANRPGLSHFLGTDQ